MCGAKVRGAARRTNTGKARWRGTKKGGVTKGKKIHKRGLRITRRGGVILDPDSVVLFCSFVI